MSSISFTERDCVTSFNNGQATWNSNRHFVAIVLMEDGNTCEPTTDKAVGINGASLLTVNTDGSESFTVFESLLNDYSKCGKRFQVDVSDVDEYGSLLELHSVVFRNKLSCANIDFNYSISNSSEIFTINREIQELIIQNNDPNIPITNNTPIPETGTMIMLGIGMIMGFKKFKYGR